MLNMTVRTRWQPREALDKAYRRFVQELGLEAVEIVAHQHGGAGFTEIRVSSGQIEGARRVEARDLLDELVAHCRRGYGLELAYYLLHMHSAPDESAGHLVVKISAGEATEMELSSEQFDFQVREFLDTVPKG